MTVRRAVLTFAISGLCCGVAAAQSIEDARRALTAARADAVNATARARRLTAAAVTVQSEADRIRARAAVTAAQVQQAETEITATEARIRVIETLRAAQRARLAAEQGPTVRFVAALQSLARRPAALALVQPGSITDMVHVRAVLSSVLPVVAQRTASVRAELARGRALRNEAASALADLRRSQTQLVARRNLLTRQSAERRMAAAALNGSAMVEQDKAIATAEDARDIVDLIRRVDGDAALRTRLASLSGPVMRPAQPGSAAAVTTETRESDAPQARYRLPVIGQVVAGLGEVSSTGVRARGLTIATRSGALVVAPTGGRVAFAGPYRGFGEIIIIDHGRGWTSLITNLAAIDVAVGDTLDPGSPIGRAGESRPTVTVELRHNGAPVDIARIIG